MTDEVSQKSALRAEYEEQYPSIDDPGSESPPPYWHWLELKLMSLKERAERVQEGEDWDLAEFILRTVAPQEKSEA